MDGITENSQRIMLEKPYLSAPGIDFLGHAVFQKAAEPLTMHRHENCMEIVFVTKGTQNYYTENHNYPVIGGQAFISFPNQLHRTDENRQDVGEIYWMLLNLSCREDFLGFSREMSLETIGRLLDINRHIIHFDAAVKALVKRVFDEFYKKGTTPLALSSLMYLIYLILDCVKEKQALQNQFPDVEKYIENHITEEISIDTLCQLCSVSASTLQHKFKEYFGRSPAEYISYRKTQKAKEFLLAGKSVTETAMLLGFNTSDYFSTVFRKFNGTSPSLWAKHPDKQWCEREEP